MSPPCPVTWWQTGMRGWTTAAGCCLEAPRPQDSRGGGHGSESRKADLLNLRQGTGIDTPPSLKSDSNPLTDPHEPEH